MGFQPLFLIFMWHLELTSQLTTNGHISHFCFTLILMEVPLALIVLKSCSLLTLKTDYIGSKGFFPSYFVCCSVAKSCPTLHDPKDCSMPGFPVHHHLPEFAQVHVHCIGDAIQPSYPLTPSFFVPSVPAIRDFSRVGCSHQVTKIPVLQLQHQSFQWVFRVDFL